MHLLMVPRLAVKALGQNLLRTALTMLGIIIGVGAVICVVAIGEGAAASVERAITNIGANMIWVEAGGVNRGGVRTGAFGTKTLTLDDYHAIKERVSLVTNVTPQADTRVQVVYGNQNWGTSVRGVGPEYVALKNWAVVRGGMYTELDVERANNVCVLGQTLVDQLFAAEDPIGETIRVKDQPCVVVGVLDVKGQSATGQDQDDNLMEALLAAIASVSLLVGGIGIMNIMLVSVTERTREIGLRQAVGARGRDVLRQFLVEAVILSLIGGAIGIAVGALGAQTIARSFSWPTRVSANAVALAFGCSAAIGIFFGYCPARKAAMLDPIDALRFE
jgi:ABC-type antimicrobial peptide transport system permease subunit